MVALSSANVSHHMPETAIIHNAIVTHAGSSGKLAAYVVTQ
jgi:hypothetical protein